VQKMTANPLAKFMKCNHLVPSPAWPTFKCRILETRTWVVSVF